MNTHEQYPAPPVTNLARVRDQLVAKFPGRIAVLITGWDTFPVDGGAHVRQLVESFARRVGESAVADKVLLVGSCGGLDGRQPWDNVIQETVCELRADAVPMIKLLFYNSAVSRGALIGHRGNHTAVTIACSDETNSAGEIIAQQGWKAFLAPVGLCFGGGPRARLLVSTEADGASFKPLALPASGGSYQSELIDGACKDWRPEGVAEGTWRALKAKREGDLSSADELRSYVDNLLEALEGVVAAAAAAGDVAEGGANE